MKHDYKSILNELNKLNRIGMSLPTDSIKGTKADVKHDHIIFDHISIHDCYLISEIIGRGLSDKDFAKMLSAYYHHESILKPLHLSKDTENRIKDTITKERHSEEIKNEVNI